MIIFFFFSILKIMFIGIEGYFFFMVFFIFIFVSFLLIIKFIVIF